MSDIKLLKLVSGEEILAKIEMEDDGLTFVLHNPTQFIMSDQGIGIAPYLPLSKDKTIRISASHVLLTAQPQDEVYNGYNAQFGSGLVLPNGGGGLKVVR